MATYTVNIPARITSEFQSVYLLNFEFIKAMQNATPLDTIVFDFSRTKWIDAEMTVLLSMMFELAIQEVGDVNAEIDNMPEEVKTVLRKNDFFPYYGIASKLVDTYNSTITFFAETPSNDGVINKYIKEEVLSAIGDKISEDFLKEVSYCIFEIVHNVQDHSGADFFYICGQHYPKTGILRFAISDIGVGVPAKVKARNSSISSDVEAVEWAFVDGNTTKSRKEGGVGLFSIKDLLHQRGQLKLISDRAYYSIGPSGIATSIEMDQRFRGTLLCIEFDVKKCLKQRKSFGNNSKDTFNF